MTPEDRIRRLREADRWEDLAPRFLPPAAAEQEMVAPTSTRPRSGGVRAALVTAVVLALLVGAAGTLIRLVGPVVPATHASHSASPTPEPSAGTVAALPAVVGTTLVTWTDATSLPVSGTFDLQGEALAITMTCTGGGTVRWTVVGRSDSASGCRGSVVSGPETMAKDGRLVAEHRIVVRLSVTGHPRFAFRASAVAVTKVADPSATQGVAATGPGVPASLRSCTTKDLAPEAEYARWPHFQGGLLTVRSAASTDCALRDQPALHYLDADGRVIGDAASDLGSGDGGKADPVRLAAHGTAYVQIELFLLASVDRCGAVQVRGLRLGIGSAAVHVPIPASPAVGKCTDPHEIADGVGPATAFKPTGP